MMAEVRIIERKSGERAVLDIEGDVIFGDAVAALRRETRRLFTEGKVNILLNLERVRYVDSAGMGEMVSSLVAAQKEGGKVVLANLPQNVRELFEVTNLVAVFDIQTDKQSALARSNAG